MNIQKQNMFLFFILFSGLLIFTACPGPQKYSEIPEIKFKQIALFDTIDDPVLQNPVKGFRLRLGITDGDGNIGLQEGESIGLDTDSMYVNNYLSILYEIINSDTIVVDSFEGYNYRIPYIQPEGQNKVLLADIYIDISFSYSKDELPYDSIMFEFFIIDRALNKSNIETTPVIKLDTVGYFPLIIQEE